MGTVIIDRLRLKEVLAKPILKGSHSPDGKMCVMEAVAYVAGEKSERSSAMRVTALDLVLCFVERRDERRGPPDPQALHQAACEHSRFGCG